MESLNIRMIRKRFKCQRCGMKQSALVNNNQNVSPCEKCGILIYEISEKEFQTKSREDINKNYRLVFEKKDNKRIPLFDNGRVSNTGETTLPRIESRQGRYAQNINNSQIRHNSSHPRTDNTNDLRNSENQRQQPSSSLYFKIKVVPIT
jgi:hypothetical protein